jgi:hypothetical protein
LEGKRTNGNQKRYTKKDMKVLKGKGLGKLFYIVAIIPFLIAPTYSFAEMKRDWVDGKSISYPENQYLVGVGYGNTRETAERNSYAAISKIFSANITSISKDSEIYSQVQSKGRNETKDEINIEQFIEITTKRVLENVTIAETWFDNKEKVYYVLAVIDREKAGNSLKEQISSIDSQIEEMIKKSRKASDKIQKIRDLKGAIKGLIQREACNANLRVINLSGKGIDSPFSLAGVDNELTYFLRNDFSIGIEVAGEKGGSVEVAIIEGLNKQGLFIVKKGQSEDLIVKGEIEFNEAYIHNPMFKFVRWVANFQLIDKNTDRVIGSINRSGREGHLTITEAKERALKTMQEDIVSEVSKKLTEFIYGKD